MSIHQKLLNIQAEIKPVEKNGKNTFHKYDYVTINDVYCEINPALVKHGVTHYVSIVSSTVETEPRIKTVNGDNVQEYYNKASVILELVLTDAETGNELKIQGAGYAEDKASDKALYKAITGGHKYLLLHAFNLPTDNDPENEKAPTPDETRKIHEASQKPKYVPGQAKKAAASIEGQVNKKKREIINRIGVLLKEHQWTKEEFPHLKGIQDAVNASLEDLEEALSFVQKLIYEMEFDAKVQHGR